jgi:hypothetical protein
MAIVIIYGPKWSGKTRYAEQFMRHFNCKRLVDEWCAADIKPKDGDLVLTIEEPPAEIEGATVFHIDQALQLLKGGA